MLGIRKSLLLISLFPLLSLSGCNHDCDCVTLENSDVGVRSSGVRSSDIRAIPEIVAMNASDCYYKNSHVGTRGSMAPNVGAVRIHAKDGAFYASYPTVKFQRKLEKVKSRAALIKRVAKASDADFFTVGEKLSPVSPFDFQVDANSFTVFKLEPASWTFADEAFRLAHVPDTGKSPFSVLEVSQDKKIALVEFDNTVQTPKDCHYKYDIPVLSTTIQTRSDGTTTTYETKIIIDPIIGNNGGPPGGAGIGGGG